MWLPFEYRGLYSMRGLFPWMYTMAHFKAEMRAYINALIYIKYGIPIPPVPKPINKNIAGTRLVVRTRWFPRNTMNRNIPDKED